MQKAMTILGIESSCDDTAAAVVNLSLKTESKDYKTSNKYLPLMRLIVWTLPSLQLYSR